MPPLRLVFQRFTSCSGCQLTMLNCEAELPQLARLLALVDFTMATSARDDGCPVDLALVEGSIATPGQLQALLALRRRSRTLAAVGACALSGGVNALAGDGRRREEALAQLYGPRDDQGSFPPQPLARFVSVDLELPGCPPEPADFLHSLGALLRGGLPWQPAYPVCMECRIRDNPCLLSEGRQPCLGGVTRAGCGARCPSIGVICEGCRGWVVEANRGEQARLLLELGLGEGEVRARMQRFAGEGHADDSG